MWPSLYKASERLLGVREKVAGSKRNGSHTLKVKKKSVKKSAWPTEFVIEIALPKIYSTGETKLTSTPTVLN